ncbi:MAG: hypothetical protein E3K32_09535 [wastewater metagenome]|nr:hypothetical protein [Candidatus Loosdrechtia aerotolerans]
MKLSTKKNVIMFILFGLSFIVGLVFLIVPFTSQMPDGLEKVSEHTIGFVKKDDFAFSVKAPMPDYEVPGVRNKFNTRRYAGVIGVGLVFGVSILIGYILKKRKKKRGQDAYVHDE